MKSPLYRGLVTDPRAVFAVRTASTSDTRLINPGLLFPFDVRIRRVSAAV